MEFRTIIRYHGNNVFTLLICVYRPIESFFKPYVMYLNIYYVNLYDVEHMNCRFYQFQTKFRKCDYLISIFKMAVGYHGNITFSN